MTTTAPAEQRAKREYRRYGDLVKIAARISGRKPSTIYGVIRGQVVSAPVSRALAKAQAQIDRAARRKAQKPARKKAA